jgi:hypothetical protein
MNTLADCQGLIKHIPLGCGCVVIMDPSGIHLRERVILECSEVKVTYRPPGCAHSIPDIFFLAQCLVEVQLED